MLSMKEIKEGIKRRLELNGGRAILEYENGDLEIEDSNTKISMRFMGDQVMNFTEIWVGIIQQRVLTEAGEHGII